MKLILTLIFVIIAAASNAQGRFLQETSELMTDAMGQPFYPQQKYNWEGKVYLPDQYTMSTITTANGRTYRNIKAKLNLFDNTLLFTDSADREFVAAVPVTRIVFENIPAGRTTTFIKPLGDTGKALYEVLDSGKITLLKKTFLTYKDQQGFGSTIVTRIFEQKYTYHAYRNDMLMDLDRSKSAILGLMNDKSTQVDAYIESDKLKLRKQDDLVKLFQFYNRL